MVQYLGEVHKGTTPARERVALNQANAKLGYSDADCSSPIGVMCKEGIYAS